MIIKNSFKQLFRQPVKAVIFFLLMAASTMLLVFGAAMYAQNTARIKAAEELFTTVATVDQPWVDVSYSIESDPCNGERTVEHIDYGDYISPEALDFPGADYIVSPENRPYYVGYMPEMHSENRTEDEQDIVEIRLLDDPKGDEPVRAEIARVLYSDLRQRRTPDGWSSGWTSSRMEEGMVINFCLHGCQEAQLEKSKTYVTSLTYAYCGLHKNEYTPCISPCSTQYDMSGEPMDSNVFSEEAQEGRNYIEEVTPGFYEEGRGRYWLSLAEALEKSKKCYPVLAVQSLDLLPSFRKNMMELKRGRLITPEEFESGARVCMVSSDFAVRNLLYEGDKVSMSMLCSLYGYEKEADSYLNYFNFLGDCSLLNSEGEIYEPFWEAEYEIVGMFLPDYGAQEIGFTDMFIIPRQSVGAADEGNIAYFGPMSKWTASFQIPNGSIASFDAALREAVPDVEFLDISYSDMGYERTIGSLKDAGMTALLLLLAGLLSSVSIVALLLYFFVVREKRRTAIERSLGLTRWQCRASLTAALAALTIAATVTGSALGSVLMSSTDGLDMPAAQAPASTEEAAAPDRWGMGGVYNFSAKYSLWAMWDAKGSLSSLEEITAPAGIYFVAPIALLAMICASGVWLIGRSMKIEPMLLLSTKG